MKISFIDASGFDFDDFTYNDIIAFGWMLECYEAGVRDGRMDSVKRLAPSLLMIGFGCGALLVMLICSLVGM